jgi:hypothetical protein
MPARRLLPLAAAAFVLVSAGAAKASGLRPVATRVSTLATDEQRYVAWESPGKRSIVVLDTKTGRRRRLDVRCPLMGGAPAAEGRFLLECGSGETALLDVRSGVAVSLPSLAAPSYGEPGWTGAGARYVVGKGANGPGCRKLKRHEGCLALYEIATGRVSEVAETLSPDPDRPGAPPLCPALRRRVFEFGESEDPKARVRSPHSAATSPTGPASRSSRSG